MSYLVQKATGLDNPAPLNNVSGKSLHALWYQRHNACRGMTGFLPCKLYLVAIGLSPSGTGFPMKEKDT